MRDIYSKIAELSRREEFAVLATIIVQKGSAPRGIGTRFLIMEDGSFVGTIGGGLLEHQVLEEAKGVFTSHSPKRVAFFLAGTDVAETDMICGGDVEVLLEPIPPGDSDNLQMLKRAVEIGQRGGSGILATVINEDEWPKEKVAKMFLGSDGQRIGSLHGHQEIEDRLLEGMDQILGQRQPNIITYKDANGNALEVFVEPLVSDPTLYVFGGGHVSTQIVPLAKRVGFKVVVVDDRPEFADSGRFPEATEVWQEAFEGVVDRFPIDESSYLVIVTRGHIHDKTVLEQALKSPAKYIGMIGSRRKRNMIYEKLLEGGFKQDDLERVHSPIGIDIRAETPEEIAVSIVAELIRVRAGG
jgi:xanthine dehydrogenase accessory factor